MTENEMVGWHHRLDGHEFKQALEIGDRQGSLAWGSSRDRKESDIPGLTGEQGESQLPGPRWTDLVQGGLCPRGPHADCQNPSLFPKTRLP